MLVFYTVVRGKWIVVRIMLFDEVTGYYLLLFYTVVGDTNIVKGNNMVHYFLWVYCCEDYVG